MLEPLLRIGRHAIQNPLGAVRIARAVQFFFGSALEQFH
jgi:hypothetical protein